MLIKARLKFIYFTQEYRIRTVTEMQKHKRKETARTGAEIKVEIKGKSHQKLKFDYLKLVIKNYLFNRILKGNSQIISGLKKKKRKVGKA